MTDVPYPTDQERLRGNVRLELQAQNALSELGLDDAALDRLADGITSNVLYAFSVNWDPDWVHRDGSLRWAEPPGDASTQHFVECVRCKRITVHDSAFEADAWWESHERTHT